MWTFHWLSSRTKQILSTGNLKPAHIPVWITGLVIATMWIAPFIWMVSTSLKPAEEVMTKQIEWLPRHIVSDNYRKIFEYPVGRWAWNSIVVAFISTSIGVLFGSMTGYALARLHFPGRSFFFSILIASLMIPTEMTIVPMLVAFLKGGLANTYTAMILPHTANVLCVYIFRQFFLQLPTELEDAAEIDGASKFVVFWRIALPLARSPMIAATTLVFSSNWNSFLWPLMITFTEDMKTMPVGIALFTPVVGAHTQLDGMGPAMAAVTILSVPGLLVFLFLQRYFVEGISHSGIKG